MTAAPATRTAADVYADLDRLTDELCRLDTTGLSHDEVLDSLRAHERHARRMTFAGYPLILEAGERGLPDQFGCPSMGRFLRTLLRLHPREAGARARAAANAAPGHTLTGQPQPAPFAHVSESQADGSISQDHAAIIARTVDQLPDEVQAEHGDEIEAELVGYATTFDPEHLATLARRIAEHYDPDGTAPKDEREHERRRLGFRSRADGWTHVDGWLSPELTERWQTVLDTLAAPRPAIDLGDGRGLVKDTRTPAQRNHDGTLTAFETLMRVGDVPDNNGVSCTLVVTMTTEQYLSGSGLARTGHGYLVPAADACAWGGGDASVIAVAVDSMHAISHYGHAHRIFSENQRRVLTARDGGCSFPGCPEPPARCQVDHVVRSEHGGPTKIDNGHLLCRYNHREHLRQGWRPIMIDGVPHWIPPALVDPRRRPVRNTLHDTEVRTTPAG